MEVREKIFELDFLVQANKQANKQTSKQLTTVTVTTP